MQISAHRAWLHYSCDKRHCGTILQYMQIYAHRAWLYYGRDKHHCGTVLQHHHRVVTLLFLCVNDRPAALDGLRELVEYRQMLHLR